jgi:hypothetical protein
MRYTRSLPARLNDKSFGRAHSDGRLPKGVLRTGAKELTFLSDGKPDILTGVLLFLFE